MDVLPTEIIRFLDDKAQGVAVRYEEPPGRSSPVAGSLARRALRGLPGLHDHSGSHVIVTLRR